MDRHHLRKRCCDCGSLNFLIASISVVSFGIFEDDDDDDDDVSISITRST